MTNLERLITLTNDKSELILSTEGLNVIRLTLGGELISRKIIRSDRVAASSHPCGPNFDTDDLGRGLPPHGTLKNTLATVEFDRYSDGHPTETTATIPIVTDNYPEVEVTRSYSLGKKSLAITTIYHNKSNEVAPVNHGEDTYILAPYGWKGTTLNGEELDQRIRDNSIFAWEEVNSLLIPEQPRILLAQTGLPYAKLWTWGDGSGQYDTDYLSLSAIQGRPRTYFGSTSSLIAAGEKSTTKLTISLPPIPPIR